MMYKNYFKKLSAFIFIVTILSANFSALAQRKTSGAVAANNAKKSAPKCSAAWTGKIKYTRTQTTTSNKTVERVSARGEDITGFEMKYDYKASVAVTESPEKNGSSVGKATVNMKMSANETVVAVEKNSCDRGKTWRDMRGTFTSKSETSGRGKEEASVNVGVNDDGTYTVSVGVPGIRGKVSGSQNSTFSGQCTPKEGKNLTLPDTETMIDGHSLTSDGSHRADPKEPNKLSGSYSLKSPGDVTETISWNLEKCGAPLRITDLTFEDMKFPNWDDWQEIVEQKGTIDGNWVKIKATVLNDSGESKFAEVYLKETYKGDKWDGAKPDMPLKDQSFSVRIEPGEEYEVEMLWDSSGYAWFDDGRPRLLQRVKAEVWENAKLADDMTKNLKVAPKPVVLVHGLWSNWKMFESWQNILTTSHSYDWKAFPVGEKADKGVMNTGKFMSLEPGNTVSENAAQLKSYIRYAQEDRNAWHVDVVAHSSGGLIARNYINQLMPPNEADARPQISHLVMLGTPNQGSPCADVMYLVTGNKALYQVTQDFTSGFNRLNANNKGVKYSALAGNPIPTMCKSVVWNDSFVSVPSAIYGVGDNAQTKSIHTDLTGTTDFSGFVKPRLAIGPRGDHNPAMPSMPNQTGQNYRNDQNNFGAYFINASYKPPISNENLPDENFFKPDFSKTVKIAAKQSVEIEIPLEQAKDFGVTFMADPNISATLYNEKGEIAGKNLTNTPEAKVWFRSIYVDKNVNRGTWKLKLENTFDRELEAVIAAWSNAVQK